MFLSLVQLALAMSCVGIINSTGHNNQGSWDITNSYLKYPLTNQNSTYCYTFSCDGLYNFTPYEDDGNRHDYDVKLMSISLFDDSIGATFNDYISCYLSYTEDNYSIVQDSMLLTYKIADIEGPVYPKLNYYFYSSVELINSNTQQVVSIYTIFDDGFDLVPLWQTQNFPTISLPTDFRAYHIRINMCFVYLEESVYQSILREYDGSDYSAGYDLGYQNGKHDGIEIGANDYKSSQEYQDVLQQQYDLGKQAGISEGRAEVIEQGQTATIIFNGIISIALLPVNVFLRMLNLEVFGINLGALVSSLLTICVIIILVRMIFGKNGE